MDRRTLLSLVPTALWAAPKRTNDVPIGLELYTLRAEFQQDMNDTLKKVSKQGYRGVEMWGPYAEWSKEKATQFREILDREGLKCFSTHTNRKHFGAEHIERVIEYNKQFGSKLIVMSSAGELKTIEEWKPVAELLSKTAEKVRKLGMAVGFHNHKLEFEAIDKVRPIEFLAKNTPKDVVLQLDVGTCIAAGKDPVEWIRANPGRIKSLHLKDWKGQLATEEEGYRVLLGEGDAKWKEILKAAVEVGGVEAFLVEQEGADMPPVNASEKCLENLRKYL